MSDTHNVRCRDCFDEIAEVYDRARPGYPTDLVRDIVASLLSRTFYGHSANFVIESRLSDSPSDIISYGLPYSGGGFR
jgi:hypothetical protein